MNEELKNTLENIRLYVGDVERSKREIATLSEQLDEELQTMNEYTLVEELTEELKTAKDKLKSALMSNSRYNNLSEEKAQKQAQMKDQKQILSDHLVAYYHLSGGERQIELYDDGEAREVILAGKLGKEQAYQTNMFTGDKK